MKFQNFGKNVSSTPQFYYEPKSEQEVLDILNNHKNGQIRVIGGGHAWSHGIESNDAFLNLKRLNKIIITKENEKDYVYVEGGCKLEHLVKTLSTHSLMIPAMGGIMQQSVAGLASTATHGTGNSSFSHFIHEIRLAAFDENRNAKIYEFKNGDELLVARTAIGCMGVLLSLKIPLLQKYWITERTKFFTNLDDVLAEEKEWPLQQTVVIPHLWHFYGFQRKIDNEPKNKWLFTLRRGLDYLTVEILPHVFLKTILLFKNSDKIILNYYKNIIPKLLLPTQVTNQDYKALTLHTRHHYTFVHVETEIFIPERNIKDGFKAIVEIVDWYAGTNSLSEELQSKLRDKNLLEEIQSKKGKYTLHYTPFIRKVFPDESLIGMTAGKENYYAIGFFTYHKEEQRNDYYEFAKTLSLALNKLYDARLHWGKNFPLEFKDVERLYPEMQKFKDICRKMDPNGVFQNDFTKQIFDF